MGIGKFRSASIQAYIAHQWNGSQSNEYTRDSLEYFIPWGIAKTLKDFPAHTITVGKNGSRIDAPEMGRMLYMDVGRWGGDGLSPVDTAAHWRGQRSFGVVCGRVAALCQYDMSGTSRPTVDDPPNVRNLNDYIAMRAFLNHMARGQGIGRLEVVKALACESPGALAPSNGTIWVFLGDIHAPVVTFNDRTYMGGWPQRSPPRPDRVPSRGRLDMTAVRNNSLAINALLIALTPVALNPLTAPIAPIVSIPALKLLVDNAFDEQKVSRWDIDMPTDDSEEWFNDYHGVDNVQRGADIFQQAGHDLAEWCNKIAEYQNNTAHVRKVRLAQLGDLFDYWIGLKRAFRNNPFTFYDETATRSFINHWEQETLSSNSSSQWRGIFELLHIDDGVTTGTPPIDPVFVYGNHDDYRRHFRNAPPSISANSILAEHGHETDSFNHDDNPTLGWALTQMAFLFPQVRLLEDPLSAAKAYLTSNDTGTRLTAIDGAIDRCIVSSLKNRIPTTLHYVMGHTHRPMLKEVVVYAGKPTD
jgi:hypothetical protein